MKNIIKLLSILMITLFTINVNAIEEESNINNQNSLNEQVITENDESTSNESSNNSNNLYLSSLSLSSRNIDFDRNNFNYETKVLYDIENIEILAVPENDNVTIDIIGNKQLLVGENKIEIKLTLNNNTTSYIIMVTRLPEGESLGNNPNIQNISIENYDIEFNPDQTQYKLVIKNENKLNIKITMEDSSSIYEITGNENLKDNSTITIKTTSVDGTEKTYTITITKSNYLPYIIGAIILLSLLIIGLLISYLKANKKEYVDINGYKIGKEYTDPLTERKVISKNKHKEKDLSKKENKPTKQSKLRAPKTYSTKLEDKVGLDDELKTYNPNEKK